MAKELPYFKFYPGEWIKGDITLCSMPAQGLFINICAFYWAKNCDMTLTNVQQRFNQPSELQELIENQVLQIKGDSIRISFLEDQFSGFIDISRKRSEAGKRSGEMRRTKPAKRNKCSTSDKQKGNYKEKIREDKEKIREDNNTSSNGKITKSKFNDFWKLYPKKTDKGKALTKWNIICTRPTKERPRWRDIKRAILQQQNTDRWKEGFIPNPTTWLNQSRWLDDPKEMVSYSDRDKSQNTVGSRIDGSTHEYQEHKEKII